MVVVFFDLPVGAKEERRDATRFRHRLLDEGFIMKQWSVCQSALNIDPLSASNIDPSCVIEEVVPVAEVVSQSERMAASRARFSACFMVEDVTENIQ